jgi:predicted nucleic acid-binding protein
VNVLLYAANEASPDHDEARTWPETAFNDAEGVALAWVALLCFIRLPTRRGIFRLRALQRSSVRGARRDSLRRMQTARQDDQTTEEDHAVV